MKSGNLNFLEPSGPLQATGLLYLYLFPGIEYHFLTRHVSSNLPLECKCVRVSVEPVVADDMLDGGNASDGYAVECFTRTYLRYVRERQVV